jgi:DNA-binding NtrC family response regulator
MKSDPSHVPPVLVVDDEAGSRRALAAWLRLDGFRPIELARGTELLEWKGERPGAVCLDLMLEDMSGLEVLRRLQVTDPELAVVVVTGQTNLETAVEAMRMGAYDYLPKPIDQERLLAAVRRACERTELSMSLRRLQSELDGRHLLGSIVGQSAPMQELARQVQRVVDSDVAVSLQGESGTGKELVARAIHHGGRRHTGPFVAINCAAIPESLHESELFGHERGAFTGAIGIHQGRFEQANGGTLFLDEVADMSALTQASLLRTLQERTIRRVGGAQEIPVDARIICATNRDLAAEVKRGRFREDLYFRLVVYPIRVPPLRDRADDIPTLVIHFLEKYKADVRKPVARVSASALAAMQTYVWPGNVRELENVVHRAMLATDGEELDLAQLPPDLRDRRFHSLPIADSPEQSITVAGREIVPLAELERRAIDQALKASSGSVEKAAKLLGMGRATLYRRLASYEAERQRS